MTKYVVSSGITSNVTLNAGDTMSVFSSGTATNIMVNKGGQEFVYHGGIASSSTVSGSQTLSAGGVSDESTVAHGGTETVLAKATASRTIIDSFGTLNVSSGAVSDAAKVSHAGSIHVFSKGVTNDSIIFGGEDVRSGGRAIASLVKRGGQLGIGGGTSFKTVLVSGGKEQVSQGGVTSLTTVNAGCLQQVMDGGTADLTTVYSGGAQSLNFGISNGTKLVSGEQYVGIGGISKKTVISNGSTENVQLSGLASASKILSGGIEIVSSGGTESGTQIDGGTLEIMSGGKAHGEIKFTGPGGTLAIDSKSMPTATIAGFAASDSIVLSAITYSTSDSVSVDAANIVTISAGGKTYNLHIAGATVGETDFSFGSGSILTRGATDQPGFLRPAASAAPASNVWDEKVVMAAATTAPASKSAGAVTSAPAPPAWQPVNALTIHQENIAQVVSSHTP